MNSSGKFDILLKTPSQEIKVLNLEYTIPFEESCIQYELEILNYIIASLEIEELDEITNTEELIKQELSHSPYFSRVGVSSTSNEYRTSFEQTYIINKETEDDNLEFGVYNKKKGINLKDYKDFINQKSIDTKDFFIVSNELSRSNPIALNSAVAYHIEPERNPMLRKKIKSIYESFENFIKKIQSEISSKTGIDMPIEDMVKQKGALDHFKDKYSYDDSKGLFSINVSRDIFINLDVKSLNDFEEVKNQLDYAKMFNKITGKSYRLGVNTDKNFKSKDTNNEYLYEKTLYTAIEHIIKNGKKPRKKSKLKNQ